MRLGLGIDTGGTYTDGVLYDFESGHVVDEAKRLTTPRDLREGIDATLRALDPDLIARSVLVSLSTTLATNACVEGRGSRAALILLGYDPKLVDQLSAEYGLTNATEIHVVRGSHGQRGEVLAEPDYAHIDRILSNISSRVEAVGVAEYWGVRDPGYERDVKRYIRERINLPVAAAHELTTEINSMRRAATTLLNARLISLIDELLIAVRASLHSLHIDAPLMIVRGDGSLMTEEFARECPVETMLSGPAASVTGAMRLSGEGDMLIADIGGTTTDLAIVRRGRTELVSDGVNVGAWRTGTRAVDIRTVGMGGDSRVEWSDKTGLALGTARALPLCALATRYPNIKDGLRFMCEEERIATYSRGVFFLLHRRPPAHLNLDDTERAALGALANGPLSIEQFSDAIGVRPYFLKLDRLEGMGIVLRASLTPTDIMHLTGRFDAFDTEASELGLKLLEVQVERPGEAIIERIMDLAGERLHALIANALLHRVIRRPEPEPQALKLGYQPMGDELDIVYNVKMPIVGIGAPAHALLERAANRLNARLVLPKRYEVANAVGAICGSILVEERVDIKPHHDALGIRGYSAHSLAGQFYSESLKECEVWAEKTAREVAEDKARRMGAQDVIIEVENYAQTGYAAGMNRQHLLLEKYVLARASGRVSITEVEKKKKG